MNRRKRIRLVLCQSNVQVLLGNDPAWLDREIERVIRDGYTFQGKFVDGKLSNPLPPIPANAELWTARIGDLLYCKITYKD